MAMLGYIKTDGGRGKAPASDCVARALAITVWHAGLPLAQATLPDTYKAVWAMADQAIKEWSDNQRRLRAEGKRHSKARPSDGIDRGTPKPVRDKLYQAAGLVKVPQPAGAPRPTLTEVASQHRVAIATTTKHSMAIADGALHDWSDFRTYEMEDDWGDMVTHERKAAAVWVPAQALAAA